MIFTIFDYLSAVSPQLQKIKNPQIHHNWVFLNYDGLFN